MFPAGAPVGTRSGPGCRCWQPDHLTAPPVPSELGGDVVPPSLWLTRILGGARRSPRQQDLAFPCDTPHAVPRLPLSPVHLCSQTPPFRTQTGAGTAPQGGGLRPFPGGRPAAARVWGVCCALSATPLFRTR